MMKTLSPLALVWLLAACASVPPLPDGIAGTYTLESMDGQPLPSADGVLDGVLELRGNRTFTWKFTMQEILEAGRGAQVPVVFEGRATILQESPAGLRIRLTRRDRASSMAGPAEEIEGLLAGDLLTFADEALTAEFRRRR